MKTILLIEDNENLNRGITLRLEKEGYKILSAFSIAQAEDFFNKQDVDLIISDIALEDGNGLDFCRKVRQRSKVYIIFLTAMDQEIDIVNGYDVGADDYIIKPFSLMVLTSKVNAFMRRIGEEQKKELISGDIRLDYREMKAYKKDKELKLSKKEIQILFCLMEHQGRIVSKEQILEQVWDIDGQFVDENTVAVNLSRLRHKLDDPDGKKYISNIRGIGYLWNKKQEDENE